MSVAIHECVRNRKPRGQGASRRGEILAAASRIFLEEGFAHATMRRIAAAVGVSTTALYVYFPDKMAILQAIAEATFTDLLAVLEANQQRPAPLPERFRAGLRAYIEFGLSRPDAYRLTFLSSSASSSRTCKPCDTLQPIEAADHSFAILQHDIEAMMEGGLFRPGPSLPTAEAVWACLHGTTALLLDQCKHVTTPPESLIERVIDMIVAGLSR
jgi:AcrR family transcriptional regulator